MQVLITPALAYLFLRAKPKMLPERCLGLDLTVLFLFPERGCCPAWGGGVSLFLCTASRRVLTWRLLLVCCFIHGKSGNGKPFYGLSLKPFYGFNHRLIIMADKAYGTAAALGTTSTTDPMGIGLGSGRRS